MIGTSITPIYTRNATDFAQTAAFLHEVSEGRFRFGVGVSHAPALNRMGITAGKPLSDMRQFVEDMQAVPRVGDQPPMILATLRDKMIQLAQEIGIGGMVSRQRCTLIWPILLAISATRPRHETTSLSAT